MKKLIIISLFFLPVLSLNISAQEVTPAPTTPTEKYGNTLNVGLGIGGYSGYYGADRSLPVVNVNYEFDVAKDFTLAPFISFASYSEGYYWEDNNYYYHETVIPIGVKGTYYFNQLLNANYKWDFYAAGSLGFAIVNSSWSSGYEGNRNYFSNPSPLFLDLHIGAEYHLNNKLGVFLDISSGVSTIGLAIHKLGKTKK